MPKLDLALYPEVKALSHTEQLMVLLHGVGSDGFDLISLVPFMQEALPHCHFMAPHGLEAFDMRPVGRQWFSLSSQDPDQFSQLILANMPALLQIITSKQQELKLSNQQTIIMGFSQGTMTGLYLNLIQDQPFACLVGFSGRLVAPRQCRNSATPICLIHGELDDIIGIDQMFRTAKYLTQHNITHATYTVPHLTHSIDIKGINFAVNFIKSQVAKLS